MTKQKPKSAPTESVAVLFQVVQKGDGTVDLVITPGVTAGMLLQVAQMLTNAVHNMVIPTANGATGSQEIIQGE